jgi:dimethylhistidine N-methyltransferase
MYQPRKASSLLTAPEGVALPDGVVFYDYRPPLSDFRADVMAGLSHPIKQLPAKYFYDKRGSELFEEICEQPEYYPTRTECQILEQHAEAIAKTLGEDCVLVELGSGSSRKTRYLLDALGDQIVYVAVDIARDQLREATTALAKIYPDIAILAICADYSRPFDLPAAATNGRRRALFFPGSTIGNLEPLQVRRFLKSCRAFVGKNGVFVVGVDNKKDPEYFHAAYNDAKQKTAEFNLNLLRRINRELNADFDISAFRHSAFYNPEAGRVEMHIVSSQEQTVHFGDTSINFAAGESIHTENSHKYSPLEFQGLAEACGYTVAHRWSDANEFFSVYALRVA